MKLGSQTNFFNHTDLIFSGVDAREKMRERQTPREYTRGLKYYYQLPRLLASTREANVSLISRGICLSRIFSRMTTPEKSIVCQFDCNFVRSILLSYTNALLSMKLGSQAEFFCLTDMIVSGVDIREKMPE